MKKIFIALVLVVVIMSVFAGLYPKKDHSNQGRTLKTAGTDARPVKPVDPVKQAKQVLTEVSEAKVTKSTEDLQEAFRNLDAICKKAVETCDAMLAAKYKTNQEKSLNEGGKSHGDR